MKYRTWKFAISKCIAWQGIQNDSSFKDFVYEDKGTNEIESIAAFNSKVHLLKIMNGFFFQIQTYKCVAQYLEPYSSYLPLH